MTCGDFAFANFPCFKVENFAFTGLVGIELVTNALIIISPTIFGTSCLLTLLQNANAFVNRISFVSALVTLVIQFVVIGVVGNFALQTASTLFPVLSGIACDKSAVNVLRRGDNQGALCGLRFVFVKVGITYRAIIMGLHTCLQFDLSMYCAFLCYQVAIGVACKNLTCANLPSIKVVNGSDTLFVGEKVSAFALIIIFPTVFSTSCILTLFQFSDTSVRGILPNCINFGVGGNNDFIIGHLLFAFKTADCPCFENEISGSGKVALAQKENGIFLDDRFCHFTFTAVGVIGNGKVFDCFPNCIDDNFASYGNYVAGVELLAIQSTDCPSLKFVSQRSLVVALVQDKYFAFFDGVSDHCSATAVGFVGNNVGGDFFPNCNDIGFKGDCNFVTGLFNHEVGIGSVVLAYLPMKETHIFLRCKIKVVRIKQGYRCAFFNFV